MSESISDSVVVVKLAETPQPVFKEVRGRDYVAFGEKNDYPAHLQWMADNAPKHGAIIAGKVNYIAGNGWAQADGAEDARAAGFIARANRYSESLSAITTKTSLDIETFAGAFLQVIWRRGGGQIAELYHIPFDCIRTNADNTLFYYRSNWANYRETVKVYPAFNPANPFGSQIYFLKEYRPGAGAYPVPGYLRADKYILSEIAVAEHTLGNAQEGFTPSKFITFTSGEPTDDDKRVITKKLTKGWSGPRGQRMVVFFTNGAERKPLVDDMGASALTSEDFRAVDELIQTNIYAAHSITTPALFGIAQPGKLGSRTEMRDGYEIFKNTYVNGKQRFLETHFNRIARLAGVAVPLVIQGVEPIGMEFSEGIISANMTRNEIRERAGLPAIDGGDTVGWEMPTEGAALDAETNPLLRDMTGRQWQAVQRLIRQVQKGQTTDDAARMLLKSGYGLSDEQLDILLGGPQSGDEAKLSAQFSEDDEVAIYAEYGQPREAFVMLKSRPVRAHFAGAEATTLEASILDLISKDKRITPEVMADVLNVSVDDVTKALRGLEDAGTLKTKTVGETTERSLTKPLREARGGTEAKTMEFRVMYGYEGPKDSKNRPFCAKLMDLNRLYTRTEIETLSRRLGYSVFDRRGGFYTKPGTNDTTPYCRHRWESHLVLKES